MDSITNLIKSEIKAQYKSLYKFSEATGIPYTTLSNALSKGIGGTAYDTVMRICKILDIRQSFDEDIVLFNRQFHDVYTMLTQLDEKGVHTVCAVLNAEYNRCIEEKEGKVVKGFSGIGYAPKQVVDEKHVLELVRKVGRRE